MPCLMPGLRRIQCDMTPSIAGRNSSAAGCRTMPVSRSCTINTTPLGGSGRPLARHDNKALKARAQQHDDALLREQLIQWQLDRQWQAIRRQATNLGIQLFGDLPFYVSSDSADVWSNRSLFTVKENGQLTTQSGVPPDYFSETGQLWGSPVPVGTASDHALPLVAAKNCAPAEMVDLLRLDHFRPCGLRAVPGGTAPQRTDSGSPRRVTPCCASCAGMPVALSP